MKVDLQEYITELFSHTFTVTFTEGVNKFVGLFEKIFNERLVSLLGIPRATTW
jgi:hypothetical protein